MVLAGDLAINDGYVYAAVRKAVTTKGITVVYQDRKGNVIKTAPMTVDKDATYINTGKLTAPDGYTIGIVGDIKISQNNKVYITVDQNKKSVTVIFKESGKVVSKCLHILRINVFGFPSSWISGKKCKCVTTICQHLLPHCKISPG